MTYSFNLIDQPWIPCVARDGQFVEVGLRDLLVEGHNLQAICCETPLMTAAIMPVALALLHRVFGPKDSSGWKALWKNGSFPSEPLDEYFAKWYDRFDLFHSERPFYQAHDERVQPKSIIHLIHSIGNTGTLFTHATDNAVLCLSAEEAARYLMTAQVFRTAGLSGIDEKFTDSPLTRGVLFWAYSVNVFETLLLNLLPYPGATNTVPHTDLDSPSWEQDDVFHTRHYPLGYLDYLTWQSNRVLLFPTETNGKLMVNTMTIAPGLTIAADVFSPQKRYHRKSQEDDWGFLYFNSDKALWRDYHSLLALDDGNVKPPAVVDWLAQLSMDGEIPEQYPLQLTATGMLADQAKPIFYRQDQIPLHPGLLKEPLSQQYISQAITEAESAAKALRFAAQTLAEQVLMRGGDNKPDKGDVRNLVQQWSVLSIFWMNLEPIFWEYVESLQHDEIDSLQLWRKSLIKNARDGLAAAAYSSGHSAAALKGQVIAERQLQAQINKILS